MTHQIAPANICTLKRPRTFDQSYSFCHEAVKAPPTTIATTHQLPNHHIRPDSSILLDVAVAISLAHIYSIFLSIECGYYCAMCAHAIYWNSPYVPVASTLFGYLNLLHTPCTLHSAYWKSKNKKCIKKPTTYSSKIIITFNQNRIGGHVVCLFAILSR